MKYNLDIENCLAALQKGQLILYPTDTIWGIGCDATNKQAIENIYKLKQRSDAKSLIILLANENELSKYVQNINSQILSYLKKTTKPTTVIYNAPKNLPSNLINKDGSIAIRIVKDEFCEALLHAFGKPIVSTSANISGNATAANFLSVDDKIKNGVDYIVQHRQTDLSSSAPSSIIKITEDGEMIIIR